MWWHKKFSVIAIFLDRNGHLRTCNNYDVTHDLSVAEGLKLSSMFLFSFTLAVEKEYWLHNFSWLIMDFM